MHTTNLCPMVRCSASERCHATLPKLRWSWRVGGSTPMTTKAGVGMSRHHNPNVAGREAAEQALEKAGVDRPDFVFMFASIGYDQHSLLRAVRETTGEAPLSGCSAEGTIDGDNADESNSLWSLRRSIRRSCSGPTDWRRDLVPTHAPLGTRSLKSCYPTYLLRPLACSSSRMGLRTTLSPSLQGWRKTFRASSSSHSGVGALSTTSVTRSQPISTATTKSSPMGSPTHCSQAQHRLVGLSATA